MSARRAVTALLASLAVLAAGCGVLGGGDATRVEAEFSRAFNLFPGSEVRVLGLDVGRVVDVVAEPGSSVVIAVLEVDHGVKLPRDVNAHVIQGALLGERYVELEPAYVEGPVLAPGARIPAERTTVPSEFDEILESLNDFLDAVPPEELARLIRNAADVLEGRGEQLGATLDDVAVAVATLEEADDSLAHLIARLADLNATLATRDQRMRQVIADYATLVGMLGEEGALIDAALSETARMVVELRRLTDGHLGHLDGDVESVTRLVRTLDRNLPELDRLLHGQSELYRHAARVFDLDRNWLPLVNHSEDLGRMFEDRLVNRLVGLCERLGFTECAEPGFWEGEMPERLCLPGIVACEPPAGEPSAPAAVPLTEAIQDAFEAVPGLADALESERRSRTQLRELDTHLPDAMQGVVR